MWWYVPKIYHDISMRIPIMHHYVRICKVCKVLMRRETTLHTLDWSREKQHGKQTECSDRIAFTVKGYRQDHQWLRCHKLQRFPKHGWIWLVGWYLFVYVCIHKWPSQLWVAWGFLRTCSLKAAGSNLTTHLLQLYISNDDNHIWGWPKMNDMGVGFHLAPTVRAHLSNAADCVELFHLLRWGPVSREVTWIQIFSN